jgi:hypothetical protein
LFEFRFEHARGRCWGRAFACVWDGPLVLQPEEVADVVLMTPDEVRRRAEHEPFTPDGLYVVRRHAARP